jgi:leader peptidase (prepilin peptidase)/N-methyltransferase
MMQLMPLLWGTVVGIVVAGAFGLAIGSFLNVVVYRVPAGKSIVSPPSACPRCGNEIRPYDNVPVLSWLVLRGKCRDCRSAISARYPLVEAATGVFFATVALWQLPAILAATTAPTVAAAIAELVAFLYLAGVSVALALIDLDTHTLPNVIVLPSYLVAIGLLGLSSVLAGDYVALIDGAIGLAALFALYLLLAFIYPGGMGLGDVKLAGLLGFYLAYLGWGPLIVGAFAAFALGGLFAVALMLVRRVDRKSGIPFGPWMLSGAWIGIFFGQALWSGYLALFGLA